MNNYNPTLKKKVIKPVFVLCLENYKDSYTGIAWLRIGPMNLVRMGIHLFFFN